MTTPRLLRSGPFVTLLVICGTAVSSAQADQKSAVDNAKARVDAARKIYEAMMDNLKEPAAAESQPLDPEKFYLWSRRWMEAQRDVSDKKENWIAAAEGHLARMKELEKVLKDLYETQQVSVLQVLETRFYRLEAEKWLSESKTK